MNPRAPLRISEGDFSFLSTRKAPVFYPILSKLRLALLLLSAVSMASSSQSSRVNLFSSSPELLQSDDSLPPFFPVAVFDDSPSPSHTSHQPPENAHIETIHGVEYVHFQSIYYESFLDWWKYTPIGRKCISGKIDEKFQHPRWNKCRGDLWKHFIQLAEMRTGKPVLQCQARGKIIQHGIFTKNGASGMNKHLNTKDCKSLQSRDSKQSVLQVWFRIESK